MKIFAQIQEAREGKMREYIAREIRLKRLFGKRIVILIEAGVAYV